jgi:hypothetical protein
VNKQGVETGPSERLSSAAGASLKLPSRPTVRGATGARGALRDENHKYAPAAKQSRLRRSSTLALLLVAAVLAMSQDWRSSLPACAVVCVANEIPKTGCGLTDTVCVCDRLKAELLPIVTPCLRSSCSVDDFNSEKFRREIY